MHQLVLLRHGESEWNRHNRFTGWTDVDLTTKGEAQASEAGHLLKEHGFTFDITFTSVLKRAIRTLWTVLDKADQMWLPIHCCWELNERHYGALQGLNKKRAEEQYGKDQVQAWRRSFDTSPPPLPAFDTRHHSSDRRYRHLRPDQVPCGESLRDTAHRLWPCWQHLIAPRIRQNQKVLIVAHGNSLRALIKHLDCISDTAISEVEVPMGVPLIYNLNANLVPLEKYYLRSDTRSATTRVPASADELIAH